MDFTTFLALISYSVAIFSIGYTIGKDISRKK